MELRILTVAVVALILGAVLGAVVGRLHARAGWADERARLTAADAVGLEDRFGVLSAEVLRRTSAQFLELAEQRLDRRLEDGSTELQQVVGPLRDTLGRVTTQLGDSDRRGAAAQAALVREMELVRASSEQLRDQTGALINALRKPQGGGAWGEMQLRRVVEIAGLVERCDFDVQVSAATSGGSVRPDLVVRLAGDRSIVVDAKVSLSSFLEAAEASDASTRAGRMASHAKHLRAHVDTLAAKEYWSAFPQCPEFVVLFVPGESFLSGALDADPALLEYAFRRRVHILTPATLISALRTIAFGWQQATVTENARAVAEVGRELYSRLATYAGHVDRLGRALNSAVGHYNASLGSLERNVLGSSRRLRDLGVSEIDIRPPPSLEEPVRRTTLPELAGEDTAAETPAEPAGPALGKAMAPTGNGISGAS